MTKFYCTVRDFLSKTYDLNHLLQSLLFMFFIKVSLKPVGEYPPTVICCYFMVTQVHTALTFLSVL